MTLAFASFLRLSLHVGLFAAENAIQNKKSLMLRAAILIGTLIPILAMITA